MNNTVSGLFGRKCRPSKMITDVFDVYQLKKKKKMGCHLYLFLLHPEEGMMAKG